MDRYRLENKDKIKAQREKNKDYIREYQKKYREKNKDKLLKQKRDYHRQYYIDNREHLIIKNRERRSSLTDEVKNKTREQNKIYRQKNKVKIRLKNRNWIIKKRNKVIDKIIDLIMYDRLAVNRFRILLTCNYAKIRKTILSCNRKRIVIDG
jgi:hypothetical protein